MTNADRPRLAALLHAVKWAETHPDEVAKLLDEADRPWREGRPIATDETKSTRMTE